MWMEGQPTGDSWYCVTCEKSGCYSDGCYRQYPPICEFTTVPVLTLRGLCAHTALDIYYYPSIMADHHLYWIGLTGRTYIKYDHVQAIWVGRGRAPQLLAQSEASLDSLNIGKQVWKVFKDSKCKTNGVNQLLSLDSCGKREFNCESGECISLNLRCNGEADCDDGTDEYHCRTFLSLDSYNSRLSPPSLVGPDKRTPVGCQLDVLDVHHVHETDGTIRLSLTVRLSWYDRRLKFLDLWNQPGEEKDILSAADMAAIWTPQLMYTNVDLDRF